MKYLKRFKEINESLSDIVYHFTYLSNVYSILSEDEIYLSPVFGTVADNEINDGKLYSLSTTSSRSTDVGYASSLGTDGMVRITFDGGKLNNNYKSKRVDYWQRPKDPKDPLYKDSGEGKSLYKHVSRQDELEDRIISDNDTIPNATKYIIAVDILVKPDNKDTNRNEYINNYLGNIKRLCKENGIPFHTYNEEKYFNANKKDEAIKVKELNTEIENNKHSGNYYDDDLLALLFYNNEAIMDKVYDKLSSHYSEEKLERLKNSVDSKLKTLKSDMKYLSSYRLDDKSSAYSSYIHNNKSSKSKGIRYILRQFALDMKKNGCVDIKSYLEYKKWFGKKTIKDFKNDLIKNANKEVDKLFKEQIQMLDFQCYDKDGESHDSLMKNDKIVAFYKDKIKDVKDVYAKTINEIDDDFKYTYTLGDSNIKDILDINNDKSYDDIVSEFENISTQELKNVIWYILYDMRYFFDDEIDKIKDERANQWND